MTAATPEAWTSLAVVKVAVDALTPVAVLGLGVLIARSTRRVEAVQEANKTVIARRVVVFEQVATKLNRLLCFATFVGRWKEISPDDALALKRDVDEIMYANRPLFSDELFTAYRAFMACLFAMYASPNGDALIRAGVTSPWGDRRQLLWWNPDQEAKFASDRATTWKDADTAYRNLAAAFRTDLYITDMIRPLHPPTDV